MRSQRHHRSTTRKLIASIAAMACVLGLLTTLGTWSAFSSVTSNPGNTAATGSVTLTDNDTGAAMFNYASMKPGDSDSACIQVTYTGTLPALVRVYGTTAGTGLDPYVDLTVTRGTISSGSFDSCTNFSADATNWIGSGAGVVYSGTLQGFADDWTAGVVDAKPAVPEAWTTNEVHAYKFQVTLQDNNSAQSKSATQTFTWEARNTTLYSQVVLSDNPVSYWKLDEPSGSTSADSVGGYTATHFSTPSLNQTSGVKDANTAINYDGSTQWSEVGDVYDFAGTASYSVEFWMSRNTVHETTHWRRILGKEKYVDISNRGGWWFELPPTGDPSAQKIVFKRYTGTTGVNVESTTSTQSGTWYHVVGTYDGTTMRIYVNGSLQASLATGISQDNNTSKLHLGASEAGGSYYGGLLDEVAIYNTALNAQQVTEHYNAGRR